MTTKKRRKLLALGLSFAMVLSIIPSQIAPAQSVKAASYGISNPRTDKNGVSTWDCIYFGSYYQSNSTTKEPIKWRVLSVNGEDAFLLADKNLDCQPYNTEFTEVTWEICTLRNWLNNDFYNAAFSADEKSAIKTTLVVNEDNVEYGTEGGNNTNDKVYLLSIQETLNPSYGFSEDYDESETREAKITEYVKEQREYNFESEVNDSAGWWLRSQGDFSVNAAFIGYPGAVCSDGIFVYNSTYAVRPVLHLNLSSDKWSKVGTVSAAGGSTGGSTGTAKPTILPKQTNKPIVLPKPTNEPIKVAAPARVKKLTAQNKKKKAVVLSWKKVSGAKGYQLQYATNKKFKKKKGKFIKKTKFTVKKLKKKKTYYFRVCAYKLNGKTKVYGKWSRAKKVKVKK